jgi:hypothetical protein
MYPAAERYISELLALLNILVLQLKFARITYSTRVTLFLISFDFFNHPHNNGRRAKSIKILIVQILFILQEIFQGANKHKFFPNSLQIK